MVIWSREVSWSTKLAVLGYFAWHGIHIVAYCIKYW